jgi:hypothetical protein
VNSNVSEIGSCSCRIQQLRVLARSVLERACYESAVAGLIAPAMWSTNTGCTFALCANRRDDGGRQRHAQPPEDLAVHKLPSA